MLCLLIVFLFVVITLHYFCFFVGLSDTRNLFKNCLSDTRNLFSCREFVW